MQNCERDSSPSMVTNNVDLRLLTRVRPVPVLPRGTTQLFGALSDGTLPFETLTELLEQFPSIVARLLALANSPWSSPATPVATLDAAVSRLGLGVVRSVSVALLVSSPFDTNRCPHFDAQRYWCSALLSAEAAAKIATECRDAMKMAPATARTAGLLSNIGMLWLADAIPDETDRALASVSSDPTIAVRDALVSECGAHYSHAGEALADTWSLPSQLRAAMSYRLTTHKGDDERECAAVMEFVGTLVASLFSSDKPEPSLQQLDGIGLDEDRYDAIRGKLESSIPGLNELAETLFRGLPEPS